MRALILFFIIGNVNAKVVEVNYRLLKYKIDFDSEQIVYNSSNTKLTLNKRECNAHIFKSFRIQMKKNLQEGLSDKYFVNSYSIKDDGVIKYDSLTSDRAQFFSNFYDYFKRIKIEESLSCETN